MTAAAKGFARIQDEQNPLRLRLAQPWRRWCLADAVEDWHHVRITARCDGGAELARDSAMAARLRGALGRQLTMSASPQALAGAPCPWQPPCALDVLFGQHGKVTGGLEVPKPYVVAVSAVGNDLVAEVTLFGFAGDLAEAAAEALVNGLRHGLNQGEMDRVRYRPLSVVDRSIASFDNVALAEPPSGAIVMLSMRTPLSIRSGDTVKNPAFGDLVSSLTARVQGLARWQDAALDADWRALIAEGRTLRHHAIPGAAPQHWRRGSTRQDRSFQIGGATVQWLLDNPSAELLHLLALGQTTGAGGRTALGLGRFQLDFLSACG